MKTLTLALLVSLAAFNFSACGDDEKKAIEFSLLPEAAQTFINTHFSDKQVSVVYHDQEIGDYDYEVIFTDGAEIDFDKNGNWTEVEDEDIDGVPVGVLPTPIHEYVVENHAGYPVVQISKDNREYEVELSNDIEIVFDKNGVFLHYDD